MLTPQALCQTEPAGEESRNVGVILSSHAPVGRHHGMKIGSTYVRGFRRVFHSSPQAKNLGIRRSPGHTTGFRKLVPRNDTHCVQWTTQGP